ncbi:hypothetical protein [Streptomyces sp. NPDC005799]|uniref:hypothetical protein n=1 Tax=Streptomyces sp. NPDC005799 TaxID=3154678 RepID=UPI003402E6B0
MTVRLCWNCRQPATHTLTRDGSIPLDACDNCTRIDQAEAETRGWTITRIKRATPANHKPINTVGGFQLHFRSVGPHYDPVQTQRVIGKHVYAFRTLPDRIDVWRSDMADQRDGYRWTRVHTFPTT